MGKEETRKEIEELEKDIGYRKNNVWRSSKIEGLEARLCDAFIDKFANIHGPRIEEEVWIILGAKKKGMFLTIYNKNCSYCKKRVDTYIFIKRRYNKKLNLIGKPEIHGKEKGEHHSPGIHCKNCDYVKMFDAYQGPLSPD